MLVTVTSFKSISQKNDVPDYNNLYYWAAHPLKKDIADSVPAFLRNEKRDSLVDVFYIHPTTFIKEMLRSPWNADVNNEELNLSTDNTAIKNQATVYNGRCRVFAPRYRQSHLKAFFMKKNPKAEAAFAIAYSDIRNAFNHYLNQDNKGRPIIIAGHSQGSKMAIILLKEFFDNKPLVKQLVCAYIPGADIKLDEFISLRQGNNPDDIHCILTWRSYKKGADPKEASTGQMNINPISWKNDGRKTEANEHQGMLYPSFNELQKGVITAEVKPGAGYIFVDLPEGISGRLGKVDNLHIWDMQLFYMDIRRNIDTRIEAFKRSKTK